MIEVSVKKASRQLEASIHQSNVKIIVPHNSNAIAGALYKTVTKPKTITTQKEVHGGYD